MRWPPGIGRSAGRRNASSRSAILEESAAALTQVSPSVAQIIQKCLAKEPAQRYQRAGDVRAALEAIDSGLKTSPAVSRAVARRRLWSSAAAAAVILLLAALVGLNVRSERESALNRSSAGRIDSLVVLPLENLSDDPAEEYFADGMTEALIANLAQLGPLKVISRTSAMRYRKTDKALPEIARELGVDAVLEGSVLRSGERVRITAQLIDALTDRHLWASSYERDLRDILALQREVASAIADEIHVNLTPEQQAQLLRVRPVNPGVYDAYLKGRASWYIWSEAGFRKGIEYFEKAIQQDPGFAPAYAGLADCWMGLGFSGQVPSKAAFPRARAAAAKALALDERLPEAHKSMGFIKLNYDWDWPGAAKAFQRALDLNPGLPEAHHAYAYYLRVTKRPEDALAAMKRAQELDPLSAFFAAEVGVAYRWTGQYDQAIEWQLRALELDAGWFTLYADLGATYLAKGMFKEAIAAIEKGLELAKGDRSVIDHVTLARAYALSGRNVRSAEAYPEVGQEFDVSYRSGRGLCSIRTARGGPWVAGKSVRRSKWPADFPQR